VTVAYKFLRPGRVGPFTGVTWPAPGEWLDAGAPPVLCQCGIHAMQPVALPMWMTEELWRVELTDEQELDGGIVLSRRGRLVERVAAWNDDTARAYAEACIGRLPTGGSDIVRTRAADTVAAAASVVAGATAASVGYCAARAAEAVSPGGYEHERLRQAAWLSERLGLES